MRGVRVGVNEADRDCLHAFRLKAGDDLRQRREVQGVHLLPAVIDAAGKRATQAARHEGLGLLVVQVEEVGPVAARDLQRVAKTLRRDEADLDAGALRERVDDDCRAVGEEAHRVCLDARLRHDAEHPFLVACRGGVGLRAADDGLAGVPIGFEDQEIGEGSADIGCDADGFRGHQ